MDEPPIKLNWKADGFYDGLDGSLDDWLKENHRGRAPSELTREIERLVGHAVGPHAVRIRSNRMGLYALPEESAKAISAGKRVRPDEPVPEFDPDAVWEATKRLAKALEYKVSQINRITIDLSEETRPIAIAELADLHLGGVGTDYEAIERDSKLIAATDGFYATLAGDTVDNFVAAWAINAISEQVITASVQWKLLEKHLAMFQDKVLYARIGNHDAWTAKMAQIDKFGELMSKYQVLNVQNIGVANILVGGQKYIVEASHKWWGQSKLNQLHSAMRLLDFGIADDVDVAIVEHRHTPAAGWQHKRGKRRFYIRTGTYKVRDNYSAEHGFWGAEVAPACLIYWPDKHQIMIFHDVPTTASFLTHLRQG